MGTNITIGCAGVPKSADVIEWRCEGQCGEERPPGSKRKWATSPTKGRAATEHLLLRYVKGRGTTVNNSKGRLTVDPQTLGIRFDPVGSADRGRYKCLVNNRPTPDAVVDMSVLGECMRIHIGDNGSNSKKADLKCIPLAGGGPT